MLGVRGRVGLEGVGLGRAVLAEQPLVQALDVLRARVAVRLHLLRLERLDHLVLVRPRPDHEPLRTRLRVGGRAGVAVLVGRRLERVGLPARRAAEPG